MKLAPAHAISSCSTFGIKRLPPAASCCTNYCVIWRVQISCSAETFGRLHPSRREMQIWQCLWDWIELFRGGFVSSKRVDAWNTNYRIGSNFFVVTFGPTFLETHSDLICVAYNRSYTLDCAYKSIKLIPERDGKPMFVDAEQCIVFHTGNGLQPHSSLIDPKPETYRTYTFQL